MGQGSGKEISLPRQEAEIAIIAAKSLRQLPHDDWQTKRGLTQSGLPISATMASVDPPVAFVGKRFMQKRLIPIPRLKLSRWHRWENRSRYPMKRYPGVYCLAITTRNLEGLASRWKDVVYIGMTNSRGGLAARWQQFANTINGKEGHSGGKTVVKDLGRYRTWKKKLYVCAMGIECDVRTRSPGDLTKMGWVAFLEFEALARFAKSVRGKYPKYNTK